MTVYRGYGEQDVPPPMDHWLRLDDANRKARRAFLYAAVIFGAVGFAAGAAFAGDAVYYGGTGCQLVPVTGQTHVAEVRCKNVETAGPDMNEGTMTAGGLIVHVVILHGPGNVPDTFTITPTPGYVADPQTLTLNEWAGGVVKIYPFVGS